MDVTLVHERAQESLVFSFAFLQVLFLVRKKESSRRLLNVSEDVMTSSSPNTGFRSSLSVLVGKARGGRRSGRTLTHMDVDASDADIRLIDNVRRPPNIDI